MAKLSEIIEGVPVAYIDLVAVRTEGDSVTQEVVDISAIGFVPKELIFDYDAEGKVLGVELL